MLVALFQDPGKAHPSQAPKSYHLLEKHRTIDDSTIPASISGSVEKSRQRRSRHFPVLTYYAYAPRVKTAAAFPSRGLRTGLDGPFGKTQGMLFLTDPEPLMSNLILGKFALEHPYYSTLPFMKH